MPNYKIFQDVADQARVKIYGNQDVALNTDGSGTLAVSVPETIGVTIPEIIGVTIPDAVAVTIPEAVAVTIPEAVAVTIPETVAVTIPETVAVTGTVATIAAITDNIFTVEDVADVDGGPVGQATVLGLDEWTYGVVNVSSPAATAVLQLQISPDASNWIDSGAVVTLSTTNSIGTLVSDTFLKYARVYYHSASAGDTISLNVYFQGQSL